MYISSCVLRIKMTGKKMGFENPKLSRKMVYGVLLIMFKLFDYSFIFTTYGRISLESKLHSLSMPVV